LINDEKATAGECLQKVKAAAGFLSAEKVPGLGQACFNPKHCGRDAAAESRGLNHHHSVEADSQPEGTVNDGDWIEDD
jgi:hypothetical protein